MENMVTHVCAKSNYDRLRIHKALGNWESDNNKNNKKNNVRSAYGDPLRVHYLSPHLLFSVNGDTYRLRPVEFSRVPYLRLIAFKSGLVGGHEC